MENNSLVTRGDSFDVGQAQPQSNPNQGQPAQVIRRGGGQEDILIQALSNPSAFVDEMGLTDEQATNLRALVTGGGAALGAKYLSNAFGEPIAGALGALLGGYISKKVVKKAVRRRKNYLDNPNSFGGII
jgi:hypothetical protein